MIFTEQGEYTIEIYTGQKEWKAEELVVLAGGSQSHTQTHAPELNLKERLETRQAGEGRWASSRQWQTVSNSTDAWPGLPD